MAMKASHAARVDGGALVWHHEPGFTMLRRRRADGRVRGSRDGQAQPCGDWQSDRPGERGLEAALSRPRSALLGGEHVPSVVTGFLDEPASR